MAKREGNLTGRTSLDRLGRDLRVRRIYQDSDGYWLDLMPGYWVGHGHETSQLHALTVHELRNDAHLIEPCGECVRGREKWCNVCGQERNQ